MSGDNSQGGEPGAHRLLDLARRELLETLLPQLNGDARYRARLIANAMKIAGHDMAAGPAADRAILEELGKVADRLGAATACGLDDRALRQVLAGAIREGRLDGDADFFEVLVRLVDRRRAAAG